MLIAMIQRARMYHARVVGGDASCDIGERRCRAVIENLCAAVAPKPLQPPLFLLTPGCSGRGYSANDSESATNAAPLNPVS